MKVIITKHAGKLIAGRIGTFCFEITRNAKPGSTGIDEGRISRLWLAWKDSYGTVAEYDRGWGTIPRFDKGREAVDALCARWN